MPLPRNGWVQPIEGVAGGVPVPVTPGTNGAFDSGNVDETTLVQWTRAAVTGRDTSQPAGSQNIPVEARAFGIAGFSESLNKLSVLASLAAIDSTQPAGSKGAQLEAESSANATSLASGFRNRLFVDALTRGRDGAGTTAEQWVNADLYTNVSGRSTTNLGGLYAVAVAAGFDNTGAAVLRPVETRSDANFVGAAQGLIGLHTLSTEYLFDPVGLVFKRAIGVVETTGGNNVLLGQLEARQNGYWSSVQSRRFAVTHNSESGSITAQATYVATTPTLLLSNNAAAVRAIVRSLYIAVTSASLNPVRVVIKLDSANRLSVAGTALTPQNENSGGGASAITAFNENPTATAEGGGTKREYIFYLPSGKAASITLTFNDSFIVGTTGSFLCYIFDDAGAAAPNVIFSMDYEEAA